ncbi:MAG: SDR family NAD(P)-dependent oxidoreductase [Ilumatobacteraceae bacterium]|jgi:NAD(P)-dependent dehydrogenase (short-subunit alcohol dehydrogenase family)|nr:SDR family NAD(P)-dependent oxidoreductase [Ilumatobacteraceae bacterium]MDP4834682.1 SDR family NAD(P)-dependent oxidoreductase [Ilumatobacteraceae bacterium]
MGTPTAVVTGANSGIGRATTLAFAQAGYHVFGTVRGLEKADKLLAKATSLSLADRITLVEMDVADSASVTKGFAQIYAATDQVDVLVNNAGVGGNAVTEECPIDTYTEVFNINHNGSVRCIQAVLPQMRKRGSGAIVNVSSVVGKITAIAQSPYYVSKWAVEGMSEGLAHEVAPFGIRVAIVEPGITRSSIFSKNIDAPNQSGAYDAHYRRLFSFYAAGITNATPAEEAAATILEAATTSSPRLRWHCSWGAGELLAARAAMTDEEWVSFGSHVDDEAYYDEFLTRFNLDIRPQH